MVSIIKEPQPKAKQFHGGERPKNDDDDAITVKKCIEYNFPPSSYRSDCGNKLKKLVVPGNSTSSRSHKTYDDKPGALQWGHPHPRTNKV